MLKKVYLIALISLITIFYTIEGVYADPQPPTFEEKIAEGGYKSVEDAVKEFENHFKCEVKLPTILPPISFTHNFGKFEADKEYNLNNVLNIRFVNKEIKEHIFKIEIRPINNKLDFEGKEYSLEGGAKGIYFESRQFNFFVFEKNNLQYMLGIHKQLANKVTPEIFVEIANSIYYDNKIV